MAGFNGNSPTLILGGVSAATLFSSVELNGKNNVQDVSAGTGISHEQLAAGLNAYSLKLELVYVVGGVAAIVQKLQPGVIFTLEYGPEGNTSGKPKHLQSVIVESSDLTGQKVTKEKVSFSVSVRGVDAPTTDLWAGGVYA